MRQSQADGSAVQVLVKDLSVFRRMESEKDSYLSQRRPGFVFRPPGEAQREFDGEDVGIEDRVVSHRLGKLERSRRFT
jgi:hypothetical protein